MLVSSSLLLGEGIKGTQRAKSGERLVRHSLISRALGAPLINTPLQRGGRLRCKHANRFSGFRHQAACHRNGKTAKAVEVVSLRALTPLKRGVNETGAAFNPFNPFNLLLIGSLLFPSIALAQPYLPDGGEHSISGALRGDQVRPQISASSSGGFVVWQDNVTARYGLGISARALDGNLSGAGAAFRVNQTGIGDAENPQVAVLNDGGAVFVWQGGRQSFQHIYARFMSSSNTWMSPEVQVNSSSSTFQKNPVVAVLSNGNVIVLYSSLGQLSSDSMLDVWGQLFSPAGDKIGAEFLINQVFTAFHQRSPAVAALSSGGFVAGWISEQQRAVAGEGTIAASNTAGGLIVTRPSADFYARMFDANGQPAGDELLVNTGAAGSEVCGTPSLAPSPDGGFIAAWSQRTLGDKPKGWDVFSRPFSAAGVGGGTLRLNTWTFGDQFAPQIRAAGSDYLAIWTSLGQDGSWEGVYGQFLQADGSASGGELRLNTTIFGSQKEPALASDNYGRFLAVWTSYAPASHSFDLFAQGYTSPGFVPVAGTNTYAAPPAELFNDPPPVSGGGIVGHSGGSGSGNAGLDFPAANSLPGLADPFASATGVYNGLFYDTNQVAAPSSGYFSAKVSSKRTFSGRLFLAGHAYSVSGAFDLNGQSSQSVHRAGGDLRLQLQLVRLDESGGTQLRGLVSIENGWSAQLMADRLVFSKSAHPASAYSGSYTLVIPPAADGPAGSGFGTLKIDAAGGVQWSGTLADGSKISQASALSEQGVWPLYASLYSGGGSVLGWVQVSGNRTLSGQLIWNKTSSNSKYYPQGFTNLLEVAGSFYSGTAKAAPGLALQSGTHNLIFTGGGLSDPFTNNATLGPGFRLVSPSAWKLSLGITASSGLFKGSALNPQTGKPFAFQGVLLENGNYGAGFFLGPNLSGQVFLAPMP